MATHSSILAWKIPWTEEHGGLKESETTEHAQIVVPAKKICSRTPV